jgi:hypothetical protein
MIMKMVQRWTASTLTLFGQNIQIMGLAGLALPLFKLAFENLRLQFANPEFQLKTC